jgi:hypothetical protein
MRRSSQLARASERTEERHRADRLTRRGGLGRHGRFDHCRQAHEIRKGELKVLHTFDRATLEVTAKARVTVRILILEDLKTGAKFEFEGNRIGWSHSKEVVKALVASDHEDG